MRNIKLEIEYDGSRYDGWSKKIGSSNSLTIQDKIEAVLSRMEELPIDLIGAARTEAGVHAYRQVANFHTDSKKKLYEIEQYLNRYLPRDIAVLKATEENERFHAAFHATSFVYEYHITMGEVPSVFERKYNYYSFHPLSLELMKQAAKQLIGKHDFKACSENKRQKKSTERELFSIQIYGDEKEVVISIHGDDFWPCMVRILVGTLMEVGTGKRSLASIPLILTGKDRSLAGALADAKGLFLTTVNYNEDLCPKAVEK